MPAKKSSAPARQGDIIQATIGDNASQVAVGKSIRQAQTSGSGPVTQADLDQVRAMFDELKQKIEKEAPPDKKDAALERVEELHQEVTSKKPDPSTFGYIKNWFGKNLPGLLGGVTSLVVHPLVGKVVEAASSVAADAIRRQFAPK